MAFGSAVALSADAMRQGIRIRSVGGAFTHNGRRYPIGPRLPFGHRSEAIGHHLRGARQRVYFAGDTDLFDGMAGLPHPDVALLPVAAAFVILPGSPFGQTLVAIVVGALVQLAPAVAAFRDKGVDVSGPWPADTVWVQATSWLKPMPMPGRPDSCTP